MRAKGAGNKKQTMLPEMAVPYYGATFSSPAMKELFAAQGNLTFKAQGHISKIVPQSPEEAHVALRA